MPKKYDRYINLVENFKPKMLEIVDIIYSHLERDNPVITTKTGLEYSGGNPYFNINEIKTSRKHILNKKAVELYVTAFFTYLFFNNGRASYLEFKNMGLGGPIEVNIMHKPYPVYSYEIDSLSSFMTKQPVINLFKKYNLLNDYLYWGLMLDKERDILGLLFCILPQYSDDFVVISNVIGGKKILEDKIMYYLNIFGVKSSKHQKLGRLLLMYMVDKGGCIRFTTAMDIMKSFHWFKKGVIYKGGSWEVIKKLVEAGALEVWENEAGEVLLKLSQEVLADEKAKKMDRQQLLILEDYVKSQKQKPAGDKYKDIIYLLPYKTRKAIWKSDLAENFVENLDIQEAEEEKEKRDEEIWRYDLEGLI